LERKEQELREINKRASELEKEINEIRSQKTELQNELKENNLTLSSSSTGRSLKGSSIPSVSIGNQVWMRENLNVDHFRNGDPIPQARTEEEWENAGKKGQPAWCYYANDPENGEKYGKLYNWFAVIDPRGLAPEGWKVPTTEDWSVLIDNIGFNAGQKLKSSHSWSYTGNGLNTFNFSVLPASLRLSFGDFLRGDQGGAYFWSKSEYSNNKAWCREFFDHSHNVSIDFQDKNSGMSVRCLMD
jgi:uncharacterized protein (TIGR02145 family)